MCKDCVHKKVCKIFDDWNIHEGAEKIAVSIQKHFNLDYDYRSIKNLVMEYVGEVIKKFCPYYKEVTL